jgi:hypothetical protein
VVDGDVLTRLVTWGLAGDPERSRRAADAAVAGLEVGAPREAVTTTTAALQDHRYGVSLDLPSGQWEYETEEVNSAVVKAHRHTWTSGDRSIALTLACVPDARGANWLDIQFGADLMRHVGGRGGTRPIGESDAVVAGHKTRRQTWKGEGKVCETVLLKLGRRWVHLATMADDPAEAAKLHEKAAAGLRLTD